MPPWAHIGPIFAFILDHFLELAVELFVKCEMHENINIYYVLATSETLETSLFGSLLAAIFNVFWEPSFRKAVWRHFHDFGPI